MELLPQQFRLALLPARTPHLAPPTPGNSVQSATRFDPERTAVQHEELFADVAPTKQARQRQQHPHLRRSTPAFAEPPASTEKVTRSA
ncbi:hypothetical protein [Nonomuraea roseola]|uniref:Uncharacterized protein n=1 Tax=Nonomuraea roseola TaxID=46179 RepID=A0ABV5Q7L5_9ACTN